MLVRLSAAWTVAHSDESSVEKTADNWDNCWAVMMVFQRDVSTDVMRAVLWADL